jgi:hypothetical protein
MGFWKLIMESLITVLVVLFDIIEDSKSFFSSISFKSVLAKDWSFIGSLNLADISNINSENLLEIFQILKSLALILL